MGGTFPDCKCRNTGAVLSGLGADKDDHREASDDARNSMIGGRRTSDHIASPSLAQPSRNPRVFAIRSPAAYLRSPAIVVARAKKYWKPCAQPPCAPPSHNQPLLGRPLCSECIGTLTEAHTLSLGAVWAPPRNSDPSDPHPNRRMQPGGCNIRPPKTCRRP